jgi:hypothetical protein
MSDDPFACIEACSDTIEQKMQEAEAETEEEFAALNATACACVGML